MPTYTYRCDNCGHEFDRYQSFQDQPLKVCPECRKHTLHKVYQAAGVSFKGSGFYVTDKGSKATKPAAAKPAKDKANGASETKTEKKAEPAATSEKTTATKKED